jgi:hypothetical protein
MPLPRIEHRLPDCPVCSTTFSNVVNLKPSFIKIKLEKATGQTCVHKRALKRALLSKRSWKASLKVFRIWTVLLHLSAIRNSKHTRPDDTGPWKWARLTCSGYSGLMVLKAAPQEDKGKEDSLAQARTWPSNDDNQHHAQWCQQRLNS